jgi:hypothetical protein
MVPGRRDARRSFREYQKDVIAGTLEGLHGGFPLGFPPLAPGLWMEPLAARFSPPRGCVAHGSEGTYNAVRRWYIRNVPRRTARETSCYRIIKSAMLSSEAYKPPPAIRTLRDPMVRVDRALQFATVGETATVRTSVSFT